MAMAFAGSEITTFYLSKQKRSVIRDILLQYQLLFSRGKLISLSIFRMRNLQFEEACLTDSETGLILFNSLAAQRVTLR